MSLYCWGWVYFIILQSEDGVTDAQIEKPADGAIWDINLGYNETAFIARGTAEFFRFALADVVLLC